MIGKIKGQITVKPSSLGPPARPTDGSFFELMVQLVDGWYEGPPPFGGRFPILVPRDGLFVVRSSPIINMVASYSIEYVPAGKEVWLSYWFIGNWTGRVDSLTTFVGGNPIKLNVGDTRQLDLVAQINIIN